jgi:hypothetical protein
MSRTPSRFLVLPVFAALSLSLVVIPPPACVKRDGVVLAANLFQPPSVSAAERPVASFVEAPQQTDAAPIVPLPPPIPDVIVTNLAAGAALLEEPLPPPITGDGPPMRGTRVAQTERLDVYVGLKTFSAEQVAALAPRLERYLRYNEERLGTTLGRRVSLAFYRPALAPDRSTRGVAYTEEARAEVYYRPYENIDRAAIVAAHELAHHLQAARYGPQAQKRADTILLEGMATWITGDLWLARHGAPHWRGRAQQLEASGVPLRLLGATRYGSDNAYELWASFVDFLVSNYGFEKLDALYRSSAGRAPGSADYQGVLGKSLDQLAEDWRVWVRG